MNIEKCNEILGMFLRVIIAQMLIFKTVMAMEIPTLPQNQIIIEDQRVLQITRGLFLEINTLGQIIMASPSARKLYANPSKLLDGFILKNAKIHKESEVIYSIQVKPQEYKNSKYFLLEIKVQYIFDKCIFETRFSEEQQMALIKLKAEMIDNKSTQDELYYIKEAYIGGSCTISWGFYPKTNNPLDFNEKFYGKDGKIKFNQTLIKLIESLDVGDFMKNKSNKVLFDQNPHLVNPTGSVAQDIPRSEDFFVQKTKIEDERNEYVNDLVNFFDRYYMKLFLNYECEDRPKAYPVKYVLEKI